MVTETMITAYWAQLVSTIVVALTFLYNYSRYRKGVKRISNHPGFRSLISPLSFAGFGTPRIWGIYPGFDMPWQQKHKIFAKWKSDVITSVSWTGRSILYLADAELIQKINGNAAYFPKPVGEYGMLNFFGPNLVTAAGKDWRRQQAVSKDVFNHRGWMYLWDETRMIYEGMMESTGWNKLAPGAEIKVKHAVDITLRVALLAIANAGFGMRMKWKDDPETVRTSGHTMSFQTALHIVAQSSILKLALPSWTKILPIPRLRTMSKAFDELGVYISEMIAERKEEILGTKKQDADETNDRCDLFHNLVKASIKGEQSMTDDELRGNIYIYLLAGHETTAHSIAFTFALLALWPEKQEELYRSIVDVMPKDGYTTYEYYKEFDYARAVYFETLRMFPPVQQIPKILKEDTMFVFNKTNEKNVQLGLDLQRERDAENNLLTPSSSMSSSPLATPTSELSPSNSRSSSLSAPVSVSTAATSPSVFNVSSSSTDKSSDATTANPVPQPARSNCKTLSDRTAKLEATPDQTLLLMEKDTVIFVNPPAVHYNPRYYPDPYDFKPERFIGSFKSENFLPFSSGTRVCLGRHFSEVESVCFLAYMMRDFSVHPVPAFEGETREQMKERMFRAIPLITLTPLSIPVMFRRRAPAV